MAIKPLARHLVDLSICHWFEEEEQEEQEAWFAESIPLLLQHTPRLKSFYYDATYSPAPFPVVPGAVSHSLLQRTSELKLEGIFLSGLLFTTVETLESMAVSWSTLTVLNLKQLITPQALPYFAKLPKLQALTLQIRLADYNDWLVFEGYDTGLALHTLVTTDDKVELDAGVNAFSVARCVSVRFLLRHILNSAIGFYYRYGQTSVLSAGRLSSQDSFRSRPRPLAYSLTQSTGYYSRRLS